MDNPETLTTLVTRDMRSVVIMSDTKYISIKDKSTNNDLLNITHKTKDRVTRTPLKTGGERRCSGRVSSSCFTSGTSQSSCKPDDKSPSHGGNRKTFEVMTST
jgi:hypothetical protein